MIAAGATLMLAFTAPPATAASDYQWKAVAAGLGYTCAIKSDDPIVCWGTGSLVQPGSLAGPYAAVSAGSYHACAIRFSGSLHCWGEFLETQGTPSGSFKAVGAGEAHTCAIKANADPLLDGSLLCWGNNDYGRRTPVPWGSFSALSTGGYHGCAIEATSSLLRCWGYPGYVAGAPSVAVKSVSAAYLASCAIRFDDSIVCWGSNQYGQLSNVPSGSFKSLSVGATADHTCAMRFNDAIACWGANSYGQSTPPAGSFKSVAAGYGHTCAIRTDDSIICWGRNQYGQLNVPTPPTDTTPPVITPMVTGTPGNYPWYRSDVGVSWTITDPESAITAQIGAMRSRSTGTRARMGRPSLVPQPAAAGRARSRSRSGAMRRRPRSPRRSARTRSS